MGLEIHDGAAPVADAGGAPVETVIKIDGVDRAAVEMVVGTKTIVRTKRLSYKEERDIGSAQDAVHEGRPGSAYNFSVASVRSINGMMIGWPRTQAHIDAIIDELGDDAARAVMSAYIGHMRETMDAAKNAPATATTS